MLPLLAIKASLVQPSQFCDDRVARFQDIVWALVVRVRDRAITADMITVRMAHSFGLTFLGVGFISVVRDYLSYN